MQSLLLLFLLIFHNLPILPLATTNNFIEAPYFQNSPQCKPTNHNTIHIAMTLDEAYLRGSMAAVLSIVHHSDCPHNIFFHFIHSKNRSEELKNTMSSSFSYLRFEMYPFDEGVVKDRISVSLRKALDRPLNYARSYLARLLPEGVKRVIYLDSDVIVVDNVEKLWVKKFVDGDSAIAAPEYCDADLARYFTQEFWSDKRMSSILRKRKRKPCYFNTGVMVVDLHKWRRNDYTKAIERWMEVQKRRRIYELGSLPPFLLVFAGRVTAVEARWNQHGLGGDNYVGHCRGLHPGEASLLHWSGRGKPWVRLDEGRPCPVDALWAPYDMIKKPFHSLDH